MQQQAQRGGGGGGGGRGGGRQAARYQDAYERMFPAKEVCGLAWPGLGVLCQLPPAAAPKLPLHTAQRGSVVWCLPPSPACLPADAG